MRNVESLRRIGGLTMFAFVLDGVAALGFVAMIGFGDGQMTPLDGFVLSALLFGFFSALGSILIAAPQPQSVTFHGARLPERRRFDRRVVNLGSPTGIERRAGHDRRVAHLALDAILAPRPDVAIYQIRP